MLAEFLSDIRRIEKLLENEEFAKGFLRGYSDGDGSVNKQIEVSGSEERIGLLIKALSRVGIQASKPWVKNKAGEAIFQGKYTAKQDTWAIRIPMRGGHAARFAKEVGFGIERKRKRLAELMARSPYRAVQTPDRAGRTRASQMDRNREVMLL
jgi:intein-encoded DNA endonuclease-like protein